MTLPIYRDYNAAITFTPETKSYEIDAQARIRLDHIPKKGTLSIPNFKEATSTQLAPNEFYVDYQDQTSYRTAMGYIQFSNAVVGSTVIPTYQAVATILWASQINTIKDHIEATGNPHQTVFIPDYHDLTSKPMRGVTFPFISPGANAASAVYTFEHPGSVKQLRLRATDMIGADKAPGAAVTIDVYKNGVSVISCSVSTASMTYDNADVDFTTGDQFYVKINGMSNSLVQLSVGLQVQEA